VGFSAARQRFPRDSLGLSGAQLVGLARELTASWHPNLRALIDHSDPSTCFPINIRTSVPIAPCPTSAITVLGDAIPTMTPGRGVGTNTALRDAALLCRNLIAVRDGATSLQQAIHDYEAAMITYGFAAVLASRKQMDGRDPIHKPVVGRLVLAGMRTGMRFVNAVPPLKRRMADEQQRFRGADRE
jgi:2-polyprenyl-6-methoxyphenol hydroxylase-like FAD-dependent oxidoreductase